MSSHINDLTGVGQIAREIRLGVRDAVYHRANRPHRDLKDEAQRLQNEEQRLKNQDRKLKYAKELLALAKAHKCKPQEIHSLITLIGEEEAEEPKLLTSGPQLS